MSNFEQFLMALAFTIFFIGIIKIVISEILDFMAMRWVKKQIRNGNIKIIVSDISILEDEKTE